MQHGHVKIRILDEVSIVVVGLSDEHLLQLYNKYAVYAPNYFFNPKFKLGQWDGKIRYFQKTGKTFLYLLDDILPRIVQLGYKMELEDLRTVSIVAPKLIDANIFQHILHLDTGTPIILRDAQVEGVNALISNGYGVCVAGTGAGKTLMCAALVYVYGEPAGQTVLDRYRKNYSSREKMGALTFSDLQITILSKDAALVLGRWHLKRANDDPHGTFSLLFRKTKAGWRIVHDHTSSA